MTDDELHDGGASSTDTEHYFLDLISRAFKVGGFHGLCALLRVAGAHDADWDPFEESLRTIEDHNHLLDHANREMGPQAARRVALLMYCHLVEMSAAHELLFNLPRVASGSPYKAFPFTHLRRPKRKGSFATIPPSIGAKLTEIRKQIDEAKENRLREMVDDMYDDRVRNAVAHSDFILTDEAFRWTESGFADELPLTDLDRTIAKAFSFFGGLLRARRRFLLALARGKRFRRWPRYEVLELLSDPDGEVYGFKVYFSNGSHSRYSRKRGSADAMNMIFQPDGAINFMVGNVNALAPVYRVGSHIVASWDDLESLPREG